MTITQRKGLTFQFVPRPTAETSTGQLHIIKFFCSGGRVGRNEQFSDFCGRLHFSGLRARGGLSVRNPLIWQLRKSPVSEERDRESGVVPARRLSESNLCRAGAPPSAFDVRCWMFGVSG